LKDAASTHHLLLEDLQKKRHCMGMSQYLWDHRFIFGWTWGWNDPLDPWLHHWQRSLAVIPFPTAGPTSELRMTGCTKTARTQKKRKAAEIS